MNQNSHTLYTIAGVLFLLRALSVAVSFATMVFFGLVSLLPIFSIVLSVAGAAILTVIGVTALQHRPRADWMNAVGGVYLAYMALTHFMTLTLGLTLTAVLTLLYTLVLLVLFVITFRQERVNAKNAAQQDEARSRYAAYEMQYRCGNITREEFENLTGNRQ